MWIDSNGNLYQGDCRLGDRAATQEEIDAWEAAKVPAPEVIRKQELKQISEEIMASGAWESALYVMIQFSLKEAKTNYPAQTEGLTDEQIIAALSNPESQFYNADFAKAKTHYERIKEVS